MQPARFALLLGLIGLFVWPLSYAWIPNADHNPDWINVLVPVAEWGSIACAIGAIWLGRRARSSGITSLGSTWAPRLGWLTLGLMTIAFVVAASMYRSS